MTLPRDHPEVFYGCDECGNCHAGLDNGRHLCMANFTVPSSEPIMMSIIRDGELIGSIVLHPGDEIEFNVIDNEDE